MNNDRSIQSIQEKVASLGGYLNGISFLNKDRRSNFASAFLLRCVDEDKFVEEIDEIFKMNPIPGFVVHEAQSISYGELERTLNTSLLDNTYIQDPEQEEDLGKYISFKVLDRVSEIFDHKSVDRIKRLAGTFGDHTGTATFYCLSGSSFTLAIYLFEK